MPIQRGAPLGAPSRECLAASLDDLTANNLRMQILTGRFALSVVFAAAVSAFAYGEERS